MSVTNLYLHTTPRDELNTRMKRRRAITNLAQKSETPTVPESVLHCCGDRSFGNVFCAAHRELHASTTTTKSSDLKELIGERNDNDVHGPGQPR